MFTLNFTFNHYLFTEIFFSNVFRNKNILWPPDFQNRNGDFSSNFSFLQKISSQEFWNTNSELKGNVRKRLDFDGLTGDEQPIDWFGNSCFCTAHE